MSALPRSAALARVKSTLSLSALLVEMVTSWVKLGALFGSLAGGELVHRIGRKRVLVVAGAFFTLGAFMRIFAAKGHCANLLRAIPVHVATANAALLGAAIYGLKHAA
jgi:glucokinase